MENCIKGPAFKIALFKIAIWFGPRKQGKILHTASSYIVVTMAAKKPPVLKMGEAACLGYRDMVPFVNTQGPYLGIPEAQLHQFLTQEAS